MITPTSESGLQTERTQLAWERTAVGFLTIGVLVLLRNGELPFPGRSLAPTLAFALTIVVVLIGKARSSGVMTSRAGVLAIGCATVGLATAIGVLFLSDEPSETPRSGSDTTTQHRRAHARAANLSPAHQLAPVEHAPLPVC